MEYRLARRDDLEKICDLVGNAIAHMEEQNIFQWDEFYPTREDFAADIEEGTLSLGLLNDDIAVIYAVNEACEPEYQNGDWRYLDCEYRVLHRLCVNPKYQGRGVAKGTLLHMEEELRKKNIGAVRLDAFSLNPSALALYRGGGYEKTGIADWRKGRFYLMEKRL